ncbi:MAG: hypothetical protein IPF62_10605 [Bacteroidetes bacterium]|jgi:hypothetical protein|nr:hypothetical protein [Bacteroidota bacterium]HMT36586.1 hypothetical protein [Chitinophagaceae bacterium]MBK6818461.1 hypothetical protein [Bacteroidota bacterium]MBK7040743.1 hypothetical protein [Bacteroidota bacterium]MBK9300497.1 hypothetical protein [Bacteroidota bacterium]
MKKVLFLALALFITGTSFADKKCCKDKNGSKKECSANKTSTTGVDPANADGTVSSKTTSTSQMPACCKSNISHGKSACCAKTSSTSTTSPASSTPASKTGSSATK